jgi:hypothetical protein
MKEDSSVDSFKLKCKSNKIGKIQSNQKSKMPKIKSKSTSNGLGNNQQSMVSFVSHNSLDDNHGNSSVSMGQLGTQSVNDSDELVTDDQEAQNELSDASTSDTETYQHVFQGGDVHT